MIPAAIPATEPARLARLRALAVLDTEPEPLFDSFTRLAARVCGAPIALISLVDHERQWFKSCVGVAVRETPRDLAFCAHAILDEALMEVPDARLDARFASNPFVTGEPGVRFYAGAPITMPGGERIGSLCVVDHQPRTLDATQRRVLVELAAAVAQALVMRDTNSLKAVERALRASQTLLDRTGRISGVGGWELDLATRVLRWTDQTCRIHDLAPGHQPTLEEAIHYYTPESRSVIDQAVQDGMAHGRGWDLELPLVTATGRAIWVRALGEVDFEDGRPVRLFGAFQDITARREAAAQSLALQREHLLRQQAERHADELKQLLDERSEMLDVLAHEVRQPLNNASAALQSASAALIGKGEAAATARLDRAQNVMGQVLAGIDNTLAAASLLAGGGPLERHDTDIDMLIGVVIADMPQPERARIHIDRATPTRTATMDVGLVRLALRNLLANALKYSSPGTPVQLRIADSDEPLALVLDVSDGGPGFDEGLVPRLFERGARGARGGNGLGLYIARRVMDLHGGRIELVRNGAEGSTLRLLIAQSAG